MNRSKHGEVRSFWLVMVLLFIAAVPCQAKYSGGYGEPEDPFLIANAEDIIEMSENPMDWSENFLMIADVNMVDYSFRRAVIAYDTVQGYEHQGNKFTGTFDGGQHNIHNLKIRALGKYDYYIGLFGYLDTGATIKNLTVSNADISGSNSSCFMASVGAMVGYCYESNITNCNSTGTIWGASQIGGLVGYCEYTTIESCSSNATVTGRSNSAGGLVGMALRGLVSNSYANGIITAGLVSGKSTAAGGLVAYLYEGAIISCSSSAHVTGDTEVGGLVGRVWNGAMVNQCSSSSTVIGRELVGGLAGNNEGIITNCYSTGTVDALGRAAGFVAYSSPDSLIENCFATGAVSGYYYGGLVDRILNAEISNSFWDIETTGIPTSAGGTALNSEEMKTRSVFLDAGWDFVDEDQNGSEDIWHMCADGVGYPQLAWQWSNVTPVAVAGDEQIAYASIDGMASVNLDGSNSSDENGDELFYTWTWQVDEQIYQDKQVTPTISLPVGEHNISLVVTDNCADSEYNYTTINVIGPIQTEMSILPRTLNLKRNANKILAILDLPDGVTYDQIDLNAGFTLYPGELKAGFHRFNENIEKPGIYAMFSNRDIITILQTDGSRQLTLQCRMKSGRVIYAKDTIRVIHQKRTTTGKNIKRSRPASLPKRSTQPMPVGKQRSGP